MEITTLITKYDINNKPVYAKILYKPNEKNLFAITIYEDNNSWSGEFSHELAKKNRERVIETEEVYNENVMKVLSKHTDTDYSFDLTLHADDNNAATFSWKKKLRSGALVHGSVVVHRDEVPVSKDSILDILILENLELKSKLKSVNLKNEELSQDLDKCVESLEKATELKEASEEILYGKFVQLLNSKKRRIKLLEDNISKYSKLN
ncbi:unnamed protein product [Arctia plantaginis]|uniref:Uncharacterized protein n=1 Tax=Arctia plantaginis TaxID=874455 RepID=A0A8S1ASE6_ARCPL|nr:unnamed protein product [Arctia plantaginis]